MWEETELQWKKTDSREDGPISLKTSLHRGAKATPSVKPGCIRVSPKNLPLSKPLLPDSCTDLEAVDSPWAVLWLASGGSGSAELGNNSFFGNMSYRSQTEDGGWLLKHVRKEGQQGK